MQPSLLTGNICERSPPMTCSSPASEPSLLLLVIRLSVSEKSGAEWRGEEDEREGEGVWCLIESVMLDFLWSAQQESAGSHTLFLYASSSCFLFLFFSFTSYSLFFLSLKKCNLCLHVFYLFVLVRLSCSFSDRSSLPGRVFVVLLPLSTQQRFDAFSVACFQRMHVYWSTVTCVFCVNLTQGNTVMNSTNQIPPVSYAGRTRLKTPVCFPLQAPAERAKRHSLFIKLNFPPKNISVVRLTCGHD